MISILYVDDEPDLLELGRTFLLEAGGMTVDTAPSAHSALDLLETRRYDAVVSDFQMPDMDGIAFLQYIRSHAGDLPVILFTGKGREDVVIDAINNGADYYIQKGGDPEERFLEVRQKVISAVERRRAGERIRHFNRLYAIMSGINAAVLHTQSREELFSKICRIVTTDGGFARAWIGLADGSAERILPVVCCGFGTTRLAPVPIAAEAGRSGEGLSGRAAFTRRQAVMLDAVQDAGEGTPPGNGNRCSSAAFPIWFHDAVIGTLQVYERDPAFFGSDEMHLLADICADISFALGTIEAEEQRERTKQALMESEEKFRILVEESLVGVYIIRDNRFLHVNPKFADMLGYTREEIVDTLTVDDVVAPEFRTLVQTNIRLRMSGEIKSMRYTFKGTRKDGTIIDLEVAGTVADYHGGQIILGTIIDITERMKAEEERAEKLEELSVANRKIRAAEERLWAHIAALTESQERLNESERRMTDIINFLPDATFAIDTEGKVLVWNRAIEQMTGISAAEIIGKGDYEYALPFYHERRPVLADLVLKYDEVLAGKYEGITRDGDKITAQTYLPHFRDRQGVVAWFAAAPLYDTQGRITGAIETIRDITEFEEARHALRASQERYRSIINSTHEGVVIVRDGVIVFSNPGIRRILGGYTEEEMTGKAVLSFIHPSDQPRIHKRVEDRLNGAVFHDTALFRVFAKDGAVRHLESRAVVIDWDGGPATVCFLSEISDPVKDAHDSIPAAR